MTVLARHLSKFVIGKIAPDLQASLRFPMYLQIGAAGHVYSLVGSGGIFISGRFHLSCIKPPQKDDVKRHALIAQRGK
jgi:hypothetical protein